MDKMSDNSSELHPAIKASHDVFDPVWKNLPQEQKTAIKELVAAIGQLEDRLSNLIASTIAEPPRFGEARFVIFSRDSGSLILPVREGESAGVPYELTVRADGIEELANSTRLAQSYLLNEAGFKAKDTYLDQRRAERGDIASQVTTQKVALPQPGGQSQTDNTNGLLTFPATELSATIMKGKPYWGITGGRWQKPVRIWPEVLEKAGIAEVNKDTGLAMLDDHQVYDMTGWVCHCEVNPEKGWPSKIVKLVKVG